ncbi:MAG: amidohydrolase family protein [Planctomycetes bacterium]|nr:amidohydrolase family protein [Planctomycetota bacterium]
MRILPALLLLSLPALGAAAPDLVAIKVGRAETVSHGLIEHAVILVEDGKIVTIGQDLPIEPGIPVLDLEAWTAIPGLVNAYSRIGMDSRAGDEFNPQISAFDDLYPTAEEYDELLEYGVTTLGLYPPGRAVPGRAAAVRPGPDTAEGMLVAREAYLKIYFRSDSRSKKMVRDAFAKVDDYLEKEKKAREKFDKESGGKKSEAKPDEKKPDEKAAQDGAKPEEKKDEKGKKAYVPPTPDDKVKPFLDVVNGRLNALVSIGQAADYLHLMDALGERKVNFDLRIPMTREIDIYEVEKQIGERKCRIVMEPEITMTPNTMRLRNLAQEFSAAGAKIVFLPRNDSLGAHKVWLRNVGEVVAQGLPRDVALRALTLEPAELMGVGARLGSLDKNKDANLVFLNGDPFEPSTRIMAVMLEGKIVFGEVAQ